MISAETIAELEARGLLYILGVRERTDKLVRELVLDDPAPFIPLTIAKRDDDIDYEAKAVTLAGRRYIVCCNHEQMKKDATARAAILTALERQLKKGDKSLVGNKGYRRFLATRGDDHFAIDCAKAEEDAKFDGVFVLRTNADLTPLEAMLCYKRLWMVERAFRRSESLFATRPIFHKLDETIRGHVSCSFLALVLKKELEDRIANVGRRGAASDNAESGSWPDVLADLDSLTETEVEQDGKRFLLRSVPRPAASLALRAAGVALPPTVTHLEAAACDGRGRDNLKISKDYAYSTAERTDLVEALWRDLSVQSTTLVAFDFSSLVVLEHLRRRLERAERGQPAGGPPIRGVVIFNGGLFTDGHSHPWYTTPMLRRLPKRAHRGVGRPFRLFKLTGGVMWSKGYEVMDAEVRELYNAMRRRDGLFYLSAAAGFVADHKAQGDRLDFGRLFRAYRDQFPFLVGGSDEDPFEHRQIDLAEERLSKLGLQVERLPGGHLTTHEQPEALAALIAKFERGLARMQPAPG